MLKNVIHRSKSRKHEKINPSLKSLPQISYSSRSTGLGIPIKNLKTMINVQQITNMPKFTKKNSTLFDRKSKSIGRFLLEKSEPKHKRYYSKTEQILKKFANDFSSKL